MTPTTLAPGTRLGAFEIVSSLGEGGMGAVYRARDTKLGREVAIHRDLKPANIKVRPDGTVRVLDFGLAKAMDPTAASTANATMSPTLSMHATQAGIILGTAAYMSPEQARGGTLDRRADLWAFGVVLYEMLTGRRLFDGATVSDTLAFVLTKEPDWTALSPNTPPPIRKLLRRCLEKDRKRRLDSAADARLGGKWLVSTDGGTYPTWSRTRHEIFYASPDSHLMVASYAVEGDSFKRDKPRVWSERRFSVRPGGRSVDLHPDGERVVLEAAPENENAVKQDKLVFIFNFFDELRRLAPVAKR